MDLQEKLDTLKNLIVDVKKFDNLKLKEKLSLMHQLISICNTIIFLLVIKQCPD